MSLERAANLYGASALVAADHVRHAWQTTLPGKSESLAAGLVALATFGDLFVDELSKALFLTHSGTTRLVNRLQEAGWATRHAGDDEADRRRVLVSLTPEGRQVVGEVLTARQEALAALLKPLSPGQREQLSDILETILHHQGSDGRSLHTTCRLCDHQVCVPCPTLEAHRAATTSEP
ncbi:MarR family winged helix-turn-helix transcriptional regulator [Nonomuraea sp. NPDC048826]|uniref:MarR family winged helix-turn-helix transcriptional regulator n=1 Tax=Nonomuraea sp. NPDC048826 TaxID=3364347 RepID=UPI003724BDD0